MSATSPINGLVGQWWPLKAVGCCFHLPILSSLVNRESASHCVDINDQVEGPEEDTHA